MSSFKENLNKIEKEAFELIEKAQNIKDLEILKVSLLGKKSELSLLLSQLKDLFPLEKKEFGPKLNQLKTEIETKLQEKKEYLLEKKSEIEKIKKQNFDVSAYKTSNLEGHLHPYTQIIEEIEDIFISMGFDIFDGPEVETDYYNFTALNIPENHPARDMYDTLWLDKPNMLLRTHTSPTQIHAMLKKGAPIAGIVTGRNFRKEATDATHDIMFLQCEGIFIDKNVTLSHLLGVAQKFLKTLFKKEELDIRIRPGFFPFVEPGIEIDMRCPFCKTGCSVCKKSTWIEVFPAGLIHPNVLKAGGIDSEKYSGFAWGFGLTRLVMLKYNINDIRYFHSGKIKFLKQF
ncbi:phenylalanine--tRNA ligase subunit alpha [Candidatus Babeliales bacterium]|nr:phenylalanine--tRNA ligase subunit alpha [Candidatus Babeliales bacterium]